MKYLTLIRHAKSSWKDDGLDDFDRPLNSRGQHAVKTMAPRIQAVCKDTQVCFTSPAKRALQTAKGLTLEGVFRNDQIQPVESLYTFNMNDLLTYLVSLDDSLADVALLGHNPALEDLAFWLTGDSLDKFPTLACVRIFLPQVSWSALGPGKGRIEFFSYPKKD